MWDARAFAVRELGFENAGGSYTSLARLPSDTLALVLSAAYPDRLEFRTWWFPIAGRVPYRAYFSVESAEAAERKLVEEGIRHLPPPDPGIFDAGVVCGPPLLDPFSARTTSGWWRACSTSWPTTTSTYLDRAGSTESYASFVGHAAAIEFFCTRDGGGPDTVRCRRARDRWEDAVEVSRFIDALEARIRELFARRDVEGEALLVERERIYSGAQAEFRRSVQPALRASSYAYFADQPLNNATFLARSLYYHRLSDFDRLWQQWESTFAQLMAWIREEAPARLDPFEVATEPRAGR